MTEVAKPCCSAYKATVAPRAIPRFLQKTQQRTRHRGPIWYGFGRALDVRYLEHTATNPVERGNRREKTGFASLSSARQKAKTRHTSSGNRLAWRSSHSNRTPRCLRMKAPINKPIGAVDVMMPTENSVFPVPSSKTIGAGAKKIPAL